MKIKIHLKKGKTIPESLGISQKRTSEILEICTKTKSPATSSLLQIMADKAKNYRELAFMCYVVGKIQGSSDSPKVISIELPKTGRCRCGKCFLRVLIRGFAKGLVIFGMVFFAAVLYKIVFFN